MRFLTTVAMVVMAATTAVSAGNAGETLTPEAFLPAPEGKDAYTPCAAFGDGVYLVAWQSGRLGQGDLSQGLPPGGADILACRLNSTGKILDKEAFVICRAKDYQKKPQVAFARLPEVATASKEEKAGNDGVFLVVWQDLRGGKDWDVYAARVTPEGKVLDPDGFVVSAAPRNQALPRVAWDGKTFLVVWQDFRSGRGYDIYGARVSADGKVLDTKGVPIATGPWMEYSPAVASMGGGKSFILWLEFKGRGPGRGGRCNARATFIVDGKVSAKPVYGNFGQRVKHGPTGPGGQVPVLAAGTKGYLCSWRTDRKISRGTPAHASNAALFDPSGQRTKSFYLMKGHALILEPDLAWNGKGFTAVWAEYARKNRRSCPYDVVYCARLTADGEPDGNGVRLSGTFKSPATYPCVASDGRGGSLFAYEKHPATGNVPIKIGFRVMK